MRPNTYHDWRRLWRDAATHLGWHVYHRTIAGQPLMDRYTWILIQRMRRLKLRMDAEAGAYTTSYCQALLKMLQTDSER